MRGLGVLVASIILAIAVLNSVSYAGLDTGLIVYYSFDNCDAEDDSGNGHDGVIHGSPECVDGIKGKALKFKGQEYIEIAKGNLIPPHDPFTVIAVVQVPVKDCYPNPGCYPSDAFSIYSQRDYSGGYAINGLGLNYLGEIVYDNWLPSGPGVKSKPGAFKFGVWQFLVFVKVSDNEIHLYINGKETPYGVYNPEPPVSADTIDATLLGSGYTYDLGPYHTFYGIMDEVRIYNRALSEEEIKELYYSIMGGNAFEAGKEWCREHPEDCGVEFPQCPDCSDQYDRGFEDGKAFCKRNPEICEIEIPECPDCNKEYTKGYEEGKAFCKENPEICGIEIPECPDCEEEYTKGYEEGKAFCKENPEMCGIEVAKECPPEELKKVKEEGYEEGKAFCKENPEICGIEIPECDYSEYCATYNFIDNILHIPCVDVGEKNLWVDLALDLLPPREPIFRIKDYGEAIRPEDCSKLDRIECEKHSDICKWVPGIFGIEGHCEAR